MSWSSHSCEPTTAMTTFSFQQRIRIIACILPASEGSLGVKCWLLAIKRRTSVSLALTLHLFWPDVKEAGAQISAYVKLGLAASHKQHRFSCNVCACKHQSDAFLLFCMKQQWQLSLCEELWNQSIKQIQPTHPAYSFSFPIVCFSSFFFFCEGRRNTVKH